MNQFEIISPTQVDVWSDYVCPWCYMGGLALKRLNETEPVELTWHAFELRPEGSPPISPEYMQRIEASEPILAARFKNDFDIVLNRGPFGINTRNLHILKKFADTQGKGNEFHDAVLEGYWRNAADIGDETVQQELLRRVGVETPIAEILADAELEREVIADEQFAYQNGISGVPAMVFGEKYLVSGAQPVDVLARVVAQLKQERETEGEPAADRQARDTTRAK